MVGKIRIAIIDNGIDGHFLKNGLESSLIVDENGVCMQNTDDMKPRFKHGTNCALIIERHLKDCSLISIRILDDNGNGGIRSVESALKWCYQNKIRLVNLSLGTTHFADKSIIRSVVNEYTNKGIIIVAASANSGYTSYPASFANVIGIVAGDKFGVNIFQNQQNGIDFEIPCECEVESQYGMLPIVKSNSYAAPYVTAMAGKIMRKDNIRHIIALKRELLKLYCGVEVACDSYGVPDWITAAWSDGTFDFSNIKPYFRIYEGEYEQFETVVDTIIFTEQQKVRNYKDLGKNLVYLGKEQLRIENFENFFWSCDNRIKQIRSTKVRIEDLRLPCIACVIDQDLDIPLLIVELKNRFGTDGYNIYAVSSMIESVLYDLEYIPEEFFKKEEEENLHNFLYWQTYYQQSDGVLIAIPGLYTDKLQSITNSMDMVIYLKHVGGNYNVEIVCDGHTKESFYMEQIDCEILFEKMLHLLTEDENE